jgi:non-heme chloroperoxidase
MTTLVVVRTPFLCELQCVLAILILLVVVAALGAAAALAFAAPRTPPPLASIQHAFDSVDFRDMPDLSYFAARDGTRLKYRAYPGDDGNIVVLVHGSSGTSASMDAVARAVHATGATVYALGMRGHDGNGRSGDIDYVGQLDDDLADFMKMLGEKRQGARRTLLGFSSGGGFVLRIAGGRYGHLFDRFILVSPQLPPGAPTMRADGGGWVGVSIPRFIVLSLLGRVGFHRFDALPVLAFAVPPEMRNVQTAVYSYRMARNFGPTDDYLGDIRRAPAPVVLLAGSADELFLTDRYGPTLKPARSDLSITIVPGMGHMDMTVKPLALDAIVKAVSARLAL